jgi:hypothetical protein
MNNVTPIRPDVAQSVIEQLRLISDNASHRPSGGDGGGTMLEARVAKLEGLAEKTGEQLRAIEKDVALIRQKQDEFTKHYATKADLTEAKNSIIMWVVSAVLLAQLLPPLLKKLGL